jgi:6-phosphofructokinase 1
VFTLDVLVNLFESESKGHFDVRKSVLGHLQQGGLPTVDRPLPRAPPRARLRRARRSARSPSTPPTTRPRPTLRTMLCDIVGVVKGAPVLTDMANFDGLVDKALRRPKQQWWLNDLGRINDTLAKPSATFTHK